ARAVSWNTCLGASVMLPPSCCLPGAPARPQTRSAMADRAADRLPAASRATAPAPYHESLGHRGPVDGTTAFKTECGLPKYRRSQREPQDVKTMNDQGPTWTSARLQNRCTRHELMPATYETLCLTREQHLTGPETSM